MTTQQEHNWPSADVLERAIDMAFAINEAMGELCDDQRPQFIRDLFNAAEMVWCVWPDADEPDLFHCGLVKGIDSGGMLKTTAFLVPDEDTAELMRNSLGDGAIVPTHEMSGGVM